MDSAIVLYKIFNESDKYLDLPKNFISDYAALANKLKNINGGAFSNNLLEEIQAISGYLTKNILSGTWIYPINYIMGIQDLSSLFGWTFYVPGHMGATYGISSWWLSFPLYKDEITIFGVEKEYKKSVIITTNLNIENDNTFELTPHVFYTRTSSYPEQGIYLPLPVTGWFNYIAYSLVYYTLIKINELSADLLSSSEQTVNAAINELSVFIDTPIITTSGETHGGLMTSVLNEANGTYTIKTLPDIGDKIIYMPFSVALGEDETQTINRTIVFNKNSAEPIKIIGFENNQNAYDALTQTFDINKLKKEDDLNRQIVMPWGSCITKFLTAISTASIIHKKYNYTFNSGILWGKMNIEKFVDLLDNSVVDYYLYSRSKIPFADSQQNITPPYLCNGSENVPLSKGILDLFNSTYIKQKILYNEISGYDITVGEMINMRSGFRDYDAADGDGIYAEGMYINYPYGPMGWCQMNCWKEEGSLINSNKTTYYGKILNRCKTLLKNSQYHYTRRLNNILLNNGSVSVIGGELL